MSTDCPLCEVKAKEIERLNGILESIESDEQLWKRGEDYQKQLATTKDNLSMADKTLGEQIKKVKKFQALTNEWYNYAQNRLC